jgi:hypothetical protein
MPKGFDAFEAVARLAAPWPCPVALLRPARIALPYPP